MAGRAGYPWALEDPTDHRGLLRVPSADGVELLAAGAGDRDVVVYFRTPGESLTSEPTFQRVRLVP
jgi:hypothetical protein